MVLSNLLFTAPHQLSQQTHSVARWWQPVSRFSHARCSKEWVSSGLLRFSDVSRPFLFRFPLDSTSSVRGWGWRASSRHFMKLFRKDTRLRVPKNRRRRLCTGNEHIIALLLYITIFPLGKRNHKSQYFSVYVLHFSMKQFGSNPLNSECDISWSRGMFSLGPIILLCRDVSDNNTVCVESRTLSCQVCHAIDLPRRPFFIRVFVCYAFQPGIKQR